MFCTSSFVAQTWVPPWYLVRMRKGFTYSGNMADQAANSPDGGDISKSSALRSYPSSQQQNGSANGGLESLVAVVLKDLETRVADWGAKVESEKTALAKEWQIIEEERIKLRARTKAVEESARDVASALSEVHKLRDELEKRLAVTPMDLSAAQLQDEWRRIDSEKLDMKRATSDLQVALDRLADAQAAYELLQ
jgi:hypothetical protein